jgi:hypothetical protein
MLAASLAASVALGRRDQPSPLTNLNRLMSGAGAVGFTWSVLQMFAFPGISCGKLRGFDW